MTDSRTVALGSFDALAKANEALSAGVTFDEFCARTQSTFSAFLESGALVGRIRELLERLAADPSPVLQQQDE